MTLKVFYGKWKSPVKKAVKRFGQPFMRKSMKNLLQKFEYHKLVLGIAAALLLLAGIFSLLRFYTTTKSCPAGQHLSYILPDGSSVEMNADSKITFHPLWYRFARKIDFEGEGYFEVKKSKKFEVVSESGTTEVLGTSFNIYSRDNESNLPDRKSKSDLLFFG
jgi:ferric-dicitrate binding protein FerR (iron transport regulator)